MTVWKVDYDDFLKRHWGRMYIKVIERQLRVSEYSIRQRVMELKLPLPELSDDDISYLQEHYQSQSLSKLSTHLGLTTETLIIKLYTIGLIKPYTSVITIHQLAKELNVNRSTIYFWIKNFNFPYQATNIYQQPDLFYVHIDSFWCWVEEHAYLLRFSNISHSFLYPSTLDNKNQLIR